MKKSTRASASVVKIRSKKSIIGFGKDEELTPRDRRLTNATSKAIRRLDKRGISNFTRLAQSVASTVLSAYLGFKDPKRRRREYLIPKDKAAWLEWLVYVAKKRIHVQYLTDKELRKVIIRARPNLSPYKKSQDSTEDPTLPPCIEWDEAQVGDWIASVGWPQLRETFVRNYITGRRLVLIDCTALNKMGMTDLDAMREVTGKIRELLGTPPPNALRPIMRVAPFERFLHRKVYNGRSYDEMTFEKFCETEGFNYEIIADNKNAQIPCTCEVIITTPEQAETDDDGEGQEDDEDHSLKNAPTVEYLVRNATVRNRTIDEIMKDILDNVFLPPRERKYGKEVWGSLRRGLGEGYDDLHLYYAKDRLQFASGVAHHLIDELYKTVAILNDISQLEKHIKEDISPEDMKMFQDGAMILMEEAAPIASLLALGELDLESIFKTEPTFELYVDDVIKEAEKKTNELVPDASSFIDEVIAEAWRKIPDMNLSGLNPELRGSILRMANEMLNSISEERSDIVDSVVGGKREAGKDKGKVKDAKLTFVDQTKPRQSTPGTPSSSKPSSGSQAGDIDNDLEAARAEQAASKTTIRKPDLSRRESRRSISGKSGGDGKDKEAADAAKQGKGKGKKQHGEKDKHEKEEQVPPAAGEGEGGEGEGIPAAASAEEEAEIEDEAEEDAEATPSFTVNVAEIELDNKRMTVVEHPKKAERSKVPPTALALKLITTERRESPQPRSPMTVSTPTGDRGKESPMPRSPMTVSTPTGDRRRDSPVPRSPLVRTATRERERPTPVPQTAITIHGTANKLGPSEENKKKDSFDSTDLEGESAFNRTPTTPIINVAITQQHKKPAIAGPIRPQSQPVVPKVNKRMSAMQRDELSKPLLESKMEMPATETELFVTVHGPPPPKEGISPRQGKALPPSQHAYNQLQQQQHLRQQFQLRQQHELRQHQQMRQATPGETNQRPTTYHQKKGVLLGMGEKNPTVGQLFEPESMTPVQHQDTPSKTKPLTNFTLIPKQGQQKTTTLEVPQGSSAAPNANNQQRSSVSTAPIQVPVPTTQARASTQASAPAPIRTSVKSAGVAQTSPADSLKKTSMMSDSAQQIWEQMKEQFEQGKVEATTKEDKSDPSAATPGNKEAEDFKTKRSLLASHAHAHAHTDFVVDNAHVKEMKEHRNVLVEQWAKTHSEMDPVDPNLSKEERLRLVRVTADKVVTEICTMALTHMLLEAEAGKNTQRIMDTLKRLEKKPGDPSPGIVLWRSETPANNAKHDTATSKKAPLYQKGRQSNQSDRSDKNAAPAKGDVRKTLVEAHENQPRAGRADSSQPTQKPLRSILHSAGGEGGAAAAATPTDNMKAQAKSVVVNAVKTAYEDSSKNKPLTRSTTGTTTVRKDQYITRL